MKSIKARSNKGEVKLRAGLRETGRIFLMALNSDQRGTNGEQMTTAKKKRDIRLFDKYVTL